MELEYLELRLKNIPDQSQEVKQIKARLVDLVYLYNRLKPESVQQVRDDLQQLDQEIQDLIQKPVWPPRTMIAVGSVIALECFGLILFYHINIILFGTVALIAFYSVLFILIMSLKPHNSAVKDFHGICTTLIQVIDRENKLKTDMLFQ